MSGRLPTTGLMKSAALEIESHVRRSGSASSDDLAGMLRAVGGVPADLALGRRSSSDIEKVLKYLVSEGRLVEIKGHRHVPADSGYPLAKMWPWNLVVCQCKEHPTANSATLYLVSVYMVSPRSM